MKRRHNVFVVVSLAIAAGLALLGSWALVLASESVPEGSLSKIIAWPVVCTARGCITTRDWREQQALAARLAESVKQEAPTKEMALTSVVRRHLIEDAVVGEPVTAADARRYREEILHLTDEQLLHEASGVSFAQYEEQVILPFLQQAALQQQRKAETLEELYAGLSRERAVGSLLFHYRWDKDSGSVMAR